VNAQELFAIVGKWPREAWPKGAAYHPKSDDPNVGEWAVQGWFIPAFYAAALFREIGLDFLARGAPVRFWHCGDHWHLEIQRGYQGEHNDSLLWLIDKAIRATLTPPV